MKQKAVAKKNPSQKQAAKGKSTKPKVSSAKKALTPVRAAKKKSANKMLTAARKIQKTTKKMVDDVILKLIGRRVLERAEAVSRSLMQEANSTQRRVRKTNLS